MNVDALPIWRPFAAAGIAIGALLPLQAAGAATVRYVAPNGDDAQPGSVNKPLRTVQRCANLADPGDRCVLRAGTYRETLRPPRSGTTQAAITFEAFSGEAATISGADPVQGWTRVAPRSKVYQATVTLPLPAPSDAAFGANQVFERSRMLPQAAWPDPDPGTRTFDDAYAQPLRRPLANAGISISGQTMTIANPSIPDVRGGWVGAVVWTTEWFVSRSAIVSSSAPGGQLTATTTDASGWDRAFWFTLTGAPGALDRPGEWHYNAAQRTLALWAPDGRKPQGIEAKQREWAVDLRGRSFITLRGLRIFAATITSDEASEGLLLENLDISYPSHHLTLPELPPDRIVPGTDGFGLIGSHIHDSGVQLRGRNHVLRASRIAHSAGNLLLLEGSGHRIEDNELLDADWLASYAAAIQITGSNHRVRHNRIADAGRSAINVDWKLTGFALPGVEIAYNEITGFGALNTDLGGLYLCCRMDLAGTRIHHNRVHDGIAFSPFWDVAGIYLDLNTYNAAIDHNVVYGLPGDRVRALKAGNEFDTALEQIHHNTFVHAMDLGGRISAGNNLFLANTPIDLVEGRSNLWTGADPLFTDAAAGDFTLQPGSPAVDAGVVVPGISKPIVGGVPDIGAYEQGAPPWKAGPRATRRRSSPDS